MKELKNIQLDLLFRIDFEALVCNDNTELELMNVEIQQYIDKYQFATFYTRNHKYVRLSHINNNLMPYLEYCSDLMAIEKFFCCHLEQVIGLFENEELQAFLATDSGCCHNTAALFYAAEEILKKGESDFLQANTFYGKVKKDNILLKYDSNSNNIDTDSRDNLVFSFSKASFNAELENLKLRAKMTLTNMNTKLNKLTKRSTESPLMTDTGFVFLSDF